MAVTPTFPEVVECENDRSVRKVVWVLTSAEPVGLAVALPEWADKTFDIDGTSAGLSWGATGVCSLKGGNSGTSDAVLNPVILSLATGGGASNAVATTANKLMTVIENPLFVYPQLTTVGTNALVTVTLICRRATPMRT